ncbi:MAG: GvpL/GvpF family gas vesicle protein [Candidatus Euphemobacter frigidus]|nr:GvpL/GvpF family gas vesicle protein [Candidatus Euphemobacter frigidus]MDP8274795.1 GvpL/GvpF family gas vesicle protein [Candidatus Euphemobacter frigidus]
MDKERYLYGIIKGAEKKSFGPGGIISDEEVYTIPYRGIAGVVSESQIPSPDTMLKEALGRLLVRHQQTIEKIMSEQIVIPMKFGTTVSGDEGVREVLKKGFQRFEELLASMEGRIELDVAVTRVDLNGVIRRIGEEDREIKEFKTLIASGPPAQGFQDRIKIGIMIKEALERRRTKEEERIVDFLKKSAVDFQKHPVMDDKMIVNCAFLLEKIKEPDFDASLKELDEEYEQEVNFRCVGPLPPYSFATCRLNKIGYERLDEAGKLLRLGNNVTAEAVKEAYREIAQKEHPDRDPDNPHLEKKFEEITDAYKLLTSCCGGEEIIFGPGDQKDLVVVEIVRP